MSQFDFSRVTAAEQSRNNCELMVDCETLGVSMGAPVITIGATLFDPFATDSSEELMRRALLIRIDISDAIKYATHVDGGTLRWWFMQKDEAIKALVGDDAVSVKEAFKRLFDYCEDRGMYMDDKEFRGLSEFPKCNRYWAKDPDFDMRLMDHYYNELKMKSPWMFFKCRSVRTVQDLAWPDGERPRFKVDGVAHDARWDAVTQAMTVQAAMRRLGLSRDQDVEFKGWSGND